MLYSWVIDGGGGGGGGGGGDGGVCVCMCVCVCVCVCTCFHLSGLLQGLSPKRLMIMKKYLN